MNRKTKIGVTVMAVACVLLTWRWLTHGGDDAKPLPQATVENRKPAAAAPPFKLTRQTVADLAAARGTAAPAQRRALPASAVSRAPTTADDERATRLRQAQAATNAANVYRMIFERLDTADCKAAITRFWKLTAGKHYAELSPEDREELRTILEQPDVREVLTLLPEAARKTRCDFELDYSQGFGLLLPHLAPLRSLVSLATGAAEVASSTGDAAGAGGLIEVALRTAENAGRDELLVAQLVQIACDKKTLDCLGAMSQNLQFPEEQAYALLVDIARRDYVAGLATALRRDTAMFTGLLDRLLAGETPESVVGGDFVEGVTVGTPEEDRTLKRALQQSLTDPACVARNKAKVQELSDKLAQLLALPYDATVQARIDQLAKEANALPVDQFALIRSLYSFSAVSSSLRKAGTATDELDATFVEVATAIYRARHGRDPASAADLKEVLDKAEAYSRQRAAQSGGTP